MKVHSSSSSSNVCCFDVVPCTFPFIYYRFALSVCSSLPQGRIHCPSKVRLPKKVRVDFWQLRWRVMMRLNVPLRVFSCSRSCCAVSLPSTFAPSAFDSPETIELEINTDSSEGLILWQGVVSGPPGDSVVPSSTSLTHSLTSSSPHPHLTESHNVRLVSTPVSPSFHSSFPSVLLAPDPTVSESDSRLRLLWACWAWLWFQPLINLMHVASLTPPPVFLRRPMALAICARCMLVKRYPLKHTLFVYTWHVSYCALLIQACAAQQSLPLSTWVFVYKESVFYWSTFIDY